MADSTVVDTDILIEVGRGVTQAITHLETLEAQTVLTVSVVTKMELIVGCEDKRELRELDQFLERFQILKVNELISDKAIELLKQYRLSHGLLSADALIAATAINWNCPLLSKNQRDYRFINELELLHYPEP